MESYFQTTIPQIWATMTANCMEASDIPSFNVLNATVLANPDAFDDIPKTFATAADVVLDTEAWFMWCCITAQICSLYHAYRVLSAYILKQTRGVVCVFVKVLHSVSKLLVPHSLNNTEDLWISVMSDAGLRANLWICYHPLPPKSSWLMFLCWLLLKTLNIC